MYEQQGDKEASDSGRFARQLCIVQAQKCSKLLCQHIFAWGTSYREERDPRQGSLGMVLFVRFTVGFEDIMKQAFGEQNCVDDDFTVLSLDGQRSTGA